MITTFLLTLLLSFGVVQETAPTVLHFKHLANGEVLQKNKSFGISDKETYKIRQWKYYISHLELLPENGEPIKIAGIFLIDAFGNDSINFDLPIKKFTAIKFSVGIDSSIQVSGAQDGALDPLNGMYWAWNTGFIHYKLEGKKEITGNTVQKLQYHIGGFSGQNNTMQSVILPFAKDIKPHKKNMQLPNIYVDVLSFLNKEVVRNEKPLIMKEGNDAVEISKIIPSLFSFKYVSVAKK